MSTKVLQNFLHKPQDDTRSTNQKILTQKLATKLSELNIKRLQKSFKINAQSTKSSQQATSFKGLKNKYLFICICGIAPFENEFDNLNFPGQRIRFVTPGFQLDLTQQQLQKRAKNANFITFAQQINAEISQYPKDTLLVFVYHSFGTFSASYYFKSFYQQQKHRIKGIIQLGAGPIRMYKAIQQGLTSLIPLQKQFFQQNIDYIYSQFNKGLQKLRKNGFNFAGYKSKYNLFGLFMVYKTKYLNQLFDLNRRLPQVIKLFIYGQNDVIFQEKNLDQKVIYFAYNKQVRLNQVYQNQMINKYKRLNDSNESVKNIQQKFIYKVPKGKHSLHMQKQLVPLIQSAIDDYLRVILQ